MRLVLASGSAARRQMLADAGVPFDSASAHVDEDAIREALLAEGAHPREIAAALAEAKALRVANRYPDALVLGGDQVLALENGALLHKPETPADARDQLMQLSGQRHELWSAAILVREGAVIWRHVESARMSVRALGAEFVAAYVERWWDEIRYCVGCYRVEAEGIQLFDRIEGSHFTVMGMPLLPLLEALRLHGVLER